MSYFDKVAESAVIDMAAAGPGNRNMALNRAAFSLGRHAHMRGASIDAAIQSLHVAAEASGLHRHEVLATIGSGFRRGAENPREIDENTPFQPSELDRLISRLSADGLLARDDEMRAEKVAKASLAWERSVPISRETHDACRPALRYLNSRNIAAKTAAGVARYSPNVYGGPAIIFPARDSDGALTGIQAVLVDADGKKREHNGVYKYSRGVIANSAMTIAGSRDSDPIIICEGPEDALSVAQAAGGAATVVCTFGKAGMATYVPPRASDVTILADPDLDVARVAEALAADASTKISVVRFIDLDAQTSDANDYLREHGVEELRKALAMARPVREEIAAQARDGMSGPTIYSAWDAAALPPRRWIYDRHYLRSFVSLLAAAGGAGKTTLQIAEALCMASGRALLGEPVHERVKVWLINLEDPIEELQRRVLAAMQHYGLTREDVDGWLYLDAGRDFAMSFATQTRDGVIINEALIDHMRDRIAGEGIGMVYIDPWVAATGDITENDNGAMNRAVSAVRQIADETTCAIALVHHTRKGNGGAADADSIRGASSLLGAARAARILNRVTEDEMARLGVTGEDASGIVRVDNAKANLSAPAHAALYRRMMGVQIANGEYVAVAVPFSLPDLFDGITTRDAQRAQRDVGRCADDGEPLRASAQAARWAGHTIGATLGIDTSDAAGKARVSSILRQWIKTDVLRIESAPDPRSGRDVPVVVVGTWITGDEAGG